jgi:glucokinase
MTESRAVAIDIGGTKMAAGLVDESGLIGKLEVVSTDAAAGAISVLERAIALTRHVVSGSSPAPSTAGIAAGGWIEAATGRVVGATGLIPEWAGSDVRGQFERELRLPVTILNDAQAIGIAEARLGAGRGFRQCLCVAVGTGIGGAIVIDGRLFGGPNGFAGAVGHVPSRKNGPLCSCGRHGCIEADASGPAIARSFGHCKGRFDESTSTEARASEASLADVIHGLDSSDHRESRCARHAIGNAGERLGRVLGGLANVIDPDVIIVSGGATAALGEPFLAAIRSAVSEVTLPHINPGLAAAQIPIGGGVVGAGLVALEALRGGVGRYATMS